MTQPTIPRTNSEFELYINSAYLDGLRALYNQEQFPLSQWDDDFYNLEPLAYELNDPILQLQMLKRTRNLSILEKGLSSTVKAFRVAVLSNEYFLDEWEDSLFRIEKLKAIGLGKFVESLDVDEKRAFLYGNPNFNKTSVLKVVFEAYRMGTTTIETDAWLAGTLAAKLSKHTFEDFFTTRSYEPPFDDWDRQKLISNFMISILEAHPETIRMVSINAQHNEYPKFSFSPDSAYFEAATSNLEVVFERDTEILPAVYQLLKVIDESRSNQINQAGILICLLAQRFESMIEQGQFEKHSNINIEGILAILGSTMLKWGGDWESEELLPLLASGCKSVRRFASKRVNWTKFKSPQLLVATKDLWSKLLDLDGKDFLEPMAQNKFAIGLTKFPYSDEWYDQKDEAGEFFGEDELENIASYFKDFFDISTSQNYEDLSWSFPYDRNQSEEEWIKLKSRNNPTATSWDLRTLDQLSIKELIDRQVDLASDEELELKHFALIQAELSKRTLLKGAEQDTEETYLLKPAVLDPVVTKTISEIRSSLSVISFLLIGLIGIVLYLSRS